MKKFSIINTAFDKTKKEMAISMAILLVLTFGLSGVFYVVESVAQPDVFESYSDALVWGYTRYIEGGDGVFDGGPVTVVGKVIASLFGFIGIAIVAIPAGLIGSGFIDAMEEEKHEQKIEGYYEPVTRLFKRGRNITAKEFFNNLPDGHPDKGRKLILVPRTVPLAKLQIRAGMDVKDIFELAQKHPEFRIVNVAAAFSEEDNIDDRLMLTHQPINRPYGYFVNRGSKITIVATSSVLDVNTGWFAYHLAKVGGFNYISKDVEVDMTDFDSFYSMSKEVKVNGQTRAELEKDKQGNKDKLERLAAKEENRKVFLRDLKTLAEGEDRWMFFVSTSVKNGSNHVDFCISNSKADGSMCAITTEAQEKYSDLTSLLYTCMKEEFSLVAEPSNRYPLENSFVGYHLKDTNPGLKFSAMRLSVSSDVVVKKNNTIVIIYRMAQCINQVLGGNGMMPEDAKDYETQGYGYTEHEWNRNA